MDFGWLKRIFKKKNLSNTNTSELATIDTSFIRVPKLSELSDENQLLVKKYLQEIRPDEYESVLKYSEELLNKSNSEIECFMNNLDEIIKDISSVISELNKENYFKMLLNKEEIRQSVDEFYKIIDEAKLRLIALDMYIKKEEKRKYDILGIFGKDERIEYLIFKNRLLNERDRLKTTIKIASQHLLATFKALKEEKTHIKYLMMTDDLYDYYKNVYVHDLEQKIIRVPNDTKYSELSTYLDQELAKEQEQQKVLSKTL